MQYVVACVACGHDGAVPEQVFERVVSGKAILRCAHCKSPITLNEHSARRPLSVPPAKGGTLLGGLARPTQAASEQAAAAALAAPERAPSLAPLPPLPPPASAKVALAVPSVVATLVMPVAPPPAGLAEPSADAEHTNAAVVMPEAIPMHESLPALPLRRGPSVGSVVGIAAVFAALAAGTFFILGKAPSAKESAAVAQAPKPAQAAPPAAAPLVASATPTPAAAPAPEPQPPVAAQPGASAAPAAPAASSFAIPSYVSEKVVLGRTEIQLRKAEACHPGGRAVGKAQVFLTFKPDGHVSEARIEGEPIASAPVAACILEHMRSTYVPKFDGAPFTIRQSIRLR